MSAGPSTYPGPAVHGGPERLEPQGRPRGLAVAREREPPALDARPAVLALVPVDRRRRSPRPAEHEDLHVAVLVDEMPRVAPGGESHEAIERCRLDPVGREEAAHLGRVDGAVTPRADLADEVGHGQGSDAGHRARSSLSSVRSPAPRSRGRPSVVPPDGTTFGAQPEAPESALAYSLRGVGLSPVVSSYIGRSGPTIGARREALVEEHCALGYLGYDAWPFRLRQPWHSNRSPMACRLPLDEYRSPEVDIRDYH